MLPKKFYLQNNEKRKKILNGMNLYTVKYDYELNPFYGEYVKETYDKCGIIADDIGFMVLTGYEEDEVRTNFSKIMNVCYLDTNKIVSYSVTSIDVNHQ